MVSFFSFENCQRLFIHCRFVKRVKRLRSVSCRFGKRVRKRVKRFPGVSCTV